MDRRNFDKVRHTKTERGFSLYFRRIKDNTDYILGEVVRLDAKLLKKYFDTFIEKLERKLDEYKVGQRTNS